MLGQVLFFVVVWSRFKYWKKILSRPTFMVRLTLDLKHNASFRYRILNSILKDANKTWSYFHQTCMMDVFDNNMIHIPLLLHHMYSIKFVFSRTEMSHFHWFENDTWFPNIFLCPADENLNAAIWPTFRRQISIHVFYFK